MYLLLVAVNLLFLCVCVRVCAQSSSCSPQSVWFRSVIILCSTGVSPSLIYNVVPPGSDSHAVFLSRGGGRKRRKRDWVGGCRWSWWERPAMGGRCACKQAALMPKCTSALLKTGIKVAQDISIMKCSAERGSNATWIMTDGWWHAQLGPQMVLVEKEKLPNYIIETTKANKTF